MFTKYFILTQFCDKSIILHKTLKNNILYLFVAILYFGCGKENRAETQQRINIAVAENIQKFEFKQQFFCRKSVMDSANILVDSMLRAEALATPIGFQDGKDSTGAVGIGTDKNGKPKRPKLLPIADSTAVQPIF